MKKFLIFFYSYFIFSFLFLPALVSTAQDFNNYKNIHSNGNIPDDFLTLSSSKYQSDKKTISKEETGFIKKTQKQFYLESNFMINRMLMNGNVLYNDVLGIYVNKVVDELLKNKPDLRKNIKVYVVQSTIVNAYATDNGTLFINTGLLAKLETEAQLAYIMAHEITHYEEKHVINSYVHKESIKKGYIEYGGTRVESQLFAQRYDKNQEMEADLKGTDLLLASDYNPMAGIEVMYLFQTSLPFVGKSRAYQEYFKFEDISFNFKKINFDSLAEKPESEEDNTTHPALVQRIDKMTSKIEEQPNFKQLVDSKKDFVHTKEEFLNIKKQAQYELVRLFLINGQDIEAIYAAYQLLQDNPESVYLKEMMCKALYLTAKFAQKKATNNSFSYSNTEVYDISYDSKDIQYLYLLLEQMSRAELNSLALMAYMKIYPRPADLPNEIRFKDLLSDYKNNFESVSSSFVVKTQTYLYKQAFVQKIVASLPTTDAIQKSKKEKEKEQEEKNKKANIHHVVVLDPDYKKFDLRKERQTRYIASERSLVEYQDQIESTGKQASVETTIISPYNMVQTDEKKFYEHSVLTNYVEEVFYNGPEIIATDYEQVNEICSQYHSEHLALVGTYTYHLQKPVIAKIGFLVWTSVVFPTLPFGIYYATMPTYRTYNYVLVLNTKNQEIEFDDVQELKFRDSKGAVNSSIYYQFLMMRGKKK